MKPKCPHIGKPCLEHGCTHYVQLHGRDPQTGERVDDWMCFDMAMLKVALEGNKEVRAAGSEVEALRSESHRASVPLAWLSAQGTRMMRESSRRESADDMRLSPPVIVVDADTTIGES